MNVYELYREEAAKIAARKEERGQGEGRGKQILDRMFVSIV